MRGSDHHRLEGQFVDLLPLAAEYADVTFRWRQGARARLLNRGADTVDRQRAWIDARPDTERNYVIALKDGRPVGMVSLVDIDRTARKAEPARFLIGDEAAARGVPVAAEALLLLYCHAFDTLGLHRLYGIVVSANQPMMKFHEYSGMRREGVLRDHLFVDDRLHDGIVYGLLEAEFRSTTISRLNGLIAMGHAARGMAETRTTGEQA
jgi:RimJ/RimL family protein N-acetyltransferase